MKLSPLQLEYYFVAESHVTTSKEFKPGEALQIAAEDIVVQRDVKPTDEERQWGVTLRVQFTPGPEVNTPYVFTVELFGFLRVHPKYPAEKMEQLVQTNGPALLYGIAREVVRDLTARGPFSPMILPTASFVPDPKEVAEDAEKPVLAEKAEPLVSAI